MLYRSIYRTGVRVLFLSYSSSRGVWRYLFSMDRVGKVLTPSLFNLILTSGAYRYNNNFNQTVKEHISTSCFYKNTRVI